MSGLCRIFRTRVNTGQHAVCLDSVDKCMDMPKDRRMDKKGNYISVAEAAELLGLDKRTIHRRIASGQYASVYKLPGIRGSYVLDRSEVISEGEVSF